MDEEVHPSEASRVASAVEQGAKLAGALVGGTVGTLAGPAGSIGGAVAGVVATESLLRLGREVMERVGQRAAIRTGAAMTIIEADADDHRARGEAPRTDGFFDPEGAMRPDAEELLESVLAMAANTFEERKLPFIAHLFDGVAHNPDVPAPDALFLARIADQLTYRQFQALSVFSQPDKYEQELMRIETSKGEGQLQDATVLRELDDLGRRGVLGAKGTSGDIRDPARLVGQGTLRDYPYSRLRPTEVGVRLGCLMQLSAMPESEREDWLRQLARLPPGASEQ